MRNVSYLGPYWTYFTALWLKISGGDPLITGYVSSFIGAVTCLALYFFIKRISTSSAALISALIYATSPLVVFFDQKYWNPSAAPLLIILILLCLSLSSLSPWYFVASIILYGFVWHVHLALVPLFLIIILAYYKQRPKMSLRHFLVSIVGVILVLLPLIIFDFNHAFSNLKTPLRMLSSQAPHTVSLSNHLSSYTNSIARLFWVNPGSSNVMEARDPCYPNSLPSTPSPILGIVIAIVGIIIVIKYRSNPFGWVLILFPLTYILYPGEVSPYYLLGYFPLLIGAVAIFLSSFPKPLHTITLLGILSLNIFLLYLVDERYGYLQKKQIIVDSGTVIQDKPYGLTWSSACFTNEGWRYLYSNLLGFPPSVSPVDGIFGWLYDPNEVKIKSEVMIDLTPSTNGYAYKLIPNP